MEQQSQHESTSETYVHLRLLAQRLLSPRFGPVGINPDVTFLIGELPSDLATALPLPPDTRIIGTMLSSFGTIGSPTPRTTSIIDVPGDQVSVFAHFATTLPASGWQVEEMPQPNPPHGGFSGGMPGVDQQVTYSHQSLGWLVIRSEGNDPNVVALRLELSPSSMFTQLRRSLRHPRPPRILPILPPMPGVVLLPNGGSGGSGQHTSGAILTGPVEISAIQSFYHERLNEAGWTLDDAAIEKRIAWSTWAFADEDKASWHGFLLIFQPNLERLSWNLRLEATLDADPFTGQGGFSSTMYGLR